MIIPKPVVQNMSPVPPPTQYFTITIGKGGQLYDGIYYANIPGGNKKDVSTCVTMRIGDAEMKMNEVINPPLLYEDIVHRVELESAWICKRIE